MQAVSDRFLVACRESGNRIVRADLYYNRMKVPLFRDIPIISGSITVDGTAAQRRSGSLVLADTSIIGVSSQFLPYGFEIGVRMGVQFPDGDIEYVQLGVFQITDVNFNEASGSLPTLTLADRSHWFAEAASKTGVVDFSGQQTTAAIKSLLQMGVFTTITQSYAKIDPQVMAPNQLGYFPDLTNLTDIKIPGGTPMDGGSFWDDIQTLASSLGAECFFDADGANVILQKVPDITGDNTVADADLVVDAGATGTLIDDAKGLSRIGAYNAVQMTGALPANAASTATPPTVFVFDSDPTSTTFYDTSGSGSNAGFGRVVLQATSGTITDIPSLTAAATVLLKKGLGLTKTLSVSMLPNPALDVGDIINVVHLDASTDLALVTQIDYDLGGGLMNLSTKCPNSVTAVITGNQIDIGGGGSNPPPPSTTPPPNPIPIPPATKTTKVYKATWSQSYNANGTQTSGSDATHCYQGDDHKGDGNRKSMIGFNYSQIESDLSGKTIISCTLFLHYEHWYWNSGGTAVIGYHASTTSSPTSFSGNTNRVQSSGWPNPGSRTVSLGTAIGKLFQSGGAKGITLGPGPSSLQTYYGYASGFGHSSPPVLTIVYQ